MGATLLQDLGLESSELSAKGDKACCATCIDTASDSLLGFNA